jgi:hypothetical protein
MLEKAGKTISHPPEAGDPRVFDQYRKIKTAADHTSASRVTLRAD